MTDEKKQNISMLARRANALILKLNDLSTRNIPADLVERERAYVEYALARAEFNEAEVALKKAIYAE